MGDALRVAMSDHYLNVAPPAVDDDEEAPFKADGDGSFVSERCLNVILGSTVALQFVLLVIKLSLRGETNDAKHESHARMHAVDAVQYSVATLRNLWLIHYIRSQIPAHRLHLGDHFSWRMLLHEAICGPSAELL